MLIRKPWLVLLTTFCVLTVFYMACTPAGQKNTIEIASRESQQIFWTRSDLGVGHIKVYMDNVHTGTITNFYTDGVQCYAENSDYNFTWARYSTETEYYFFKAVADNGTMWEWTVAFEPGKCVSNELTLQNASLVVKNCNSLDGTWIRQNDDQVEGTAGMTVYFSNGQGVITFVDINGNGFKAGDVKWKNFDIATCTLDDLATPSTSAPTYLKTEISFTDQNNVFMTGGVHYKRQ